MAEEASKLIHKHGIEGAVKQKCSKEHMQQIAQFIKWKEVGKYLPEIEETVDLDDGIDIDGINARDKRSKLVKLWESRNADDATYESMIIAMCEAKEVDQATRVCKMLKPKSG